MQIVCHCNDPVAYQKRSPWFSFDACNKTDAMFRLFIHKVVRLPTRTKIYVHVQTHLSIPKKYKKSKHIVTCSAKLATADPKAPPDYIGLN